jgi:hypothetical protein
LRRPILAEPQLHGTSYNAHYFRRLAPALAFALGCNLQFGVHTPPKSVVPRPFVRTIWPIERPVPDSLQFGRMTLADLKKQYGHPSPDLDLGEDRALVLGYPLKLKEMDASKGVHADVDFPNNGQVFLFENDILVGQAYYSSHEADHTDFDETKATSIVQGQTTREQVVSLLGPSSGCRLCPADAPGKPTGLEYLYLSRRRHLGFSARTWVEWLSVQFDANGVVSDVRLRTHYARSIRTNDNPRPAAELASTSE